MKYVKKMILLDYDEHRHKNLKDSDNIVHVRASQPVLNDMNSIRGKDDTDEVRPKRSVQESYDDDTTKVVKNKKLNDDEKASYLGEILQKYFNKEREIKGEMEKLDNKSVEKLGEFLLKHPNLRSSIVKDRHPTIPLSSSSSSSLKDAHTLVTRLTELRDRLKIDDTIQPRETHERSESTQDDDDAFQSMSDDHDYLMGSEFQSSTPKSTVKKDSAKLDIATVIKKDDKNHPYIKKWELRSKTKNLLQETKHD